MTTGATQDALLNRGLLLALAERRREFIAWGSRYHAAYRKALREHRTPATIRALEDYDPVFGVHRTAESMLLDGLRDLLIGFKDPWHRHAIFRIATAQATRELDELPEPETYRKMAAAFDAALGDPR